MELSVIPEKVNLLHIEDETVIVNLVKDLLETSIYTEFNITSKSNIEDAIDFLSNECIIDGECIIDVILLDLTLPNSHGVNTFLKVRSAVEFVPIVIVSAHEDIACKCVALGAQDYLVKPEVSPSLLIRSIKYAIQRCHLEKQMRNVIMSSTLGYHMYTLRDGKLIFSGYNPAADKILGIDHKQFLGKEFSKAFPNHTPDVEIHYMQALSGIPWKNQIISYEDDNISQAYYRVNAYRTSKEQLAVTFEDITEQIKKSEELEKSRQQYKELVDVANASIFKIDFIVGKFTYVNDIFCKLTGYDREEILQLGPQDLFTNESFEVYMERQNALKHGEYIDKTVEYKLMKKNGKIMWWLFTSEFIEDKEGNVVSAKVVAIDITDKKMTEQIIKQKQLDAYSLLEEKIQDWKTELEIKSSKQKDGLKLIDAELFNFNSRPDAEVY